MDIKQIVDAVKSHASEEVRIHKEILKEAKGDVRHLVKKHLADTAAIHKAFWQELKKSAKSK